MLTGELCTLKDNLKTLPYVNVEFDQICKSTDSHDVDSVEGRRIDPEEPSQPLIHLNSTGTGPDGFLSETSISNGENCLICDFENLSGLDEFNLANIDRDSSVDLSLECSRILGCESSQEDNLNCQIDEKLVEFFERTVDGDK